MSPNATLCKNADLKFFERTDDVGNGNVSLLIEEQKNQMRLGISGGQEIKNSKLIQCINIRFDPYIYSLFH